jgi:hypothetical protein
MFAAFLFAVLVAKIYFASQIFQGRLGVGWFISEFVILMFRTMANIVLENFCEERKLNLV